METQSLLFCDKKICFKFLIICVDIWLGLVFQLLDRVVCTRLRFLFFNLLIIGSFRLGSFFPLLRLLPLLLLALLIFDSRYKRRWASTTGSFARRLNSKLTIKFKKMEFLPIANIHWSDYSVCPSSVDANRHPSWAFFSCTRRPSSMPSLRHCL